MKRIFLVILLLLLPFKAVASDYSQQQTWVTGETITAAKLNVDIQGIIAVLNDLDNDNIASNAAIANSKLNLASISQNVAFTGTLDFSSATITAETTFADLVATTADINAGTFDGIVGGTTPAAGDFSTVGDGTAGTGVFTTIKGDTSLELATGATVTGIADEDDMSSDSATLLATQQSIKKYMDDAVAYTLLSTTAVTTNNSGNIAITAGKRYRVYINMSAVATGDTTMLMRFNSASGAAVYKWTLITTVYSDTPSEALTGDVSDSKISLGPWDIGQGYVSWILDIDAEEQTNIIFLNGDGCAYSAASILEAREIQAVYVDAGAVTDFEILNANNYVMTGTVRVYELL